MAISLRYILEGCEKERFGNFQDRVNSPRSFRVFREVMCETRRRSPQIGKIKEKEFIWKRSSVVFFINVILIFRFRARFKRGRRSDAFRLTFVVYAACAT